VSVPGFFINYGSRNSNRT